MNAIKFKNFTGEDFSWKFDGIEYNFKAGQEVYMEEFKARFFAKHLIDRELNRLGKLTNDQTEIKRLMGSALPTDEVVTADEAIDIEAKKIVEEKKRVGRTKKIIKEEEFSELTQN